MKCMRRFLQLNFLNNIIAGCELTGDSMFFGNDKWGDGKNASIMFVFTM